MGCQVPHASMSSCQSGGRFVTFGWIDISWSLSGPGNLLRFGYMGSHHPGGKHWPAHIVAK